MARHLFELSDRHAFVIAADECYSEIYFDDAHPPLGRFEACRRLGRDDYRNVVMFSSLSKRSNVPGMCSGFVAGDATILQRFLLYRTYHGCAMSPSVQAASIAAWNDEAHVAENRRLYREKFRLVTPMLSPHLASNCRTRASICGPTHTNRRHRLRPTASRGEYNVTVLPGTYLVANRGINPGTGFVRIALVAETSECLEAARRIQDFVKTPDNGHEPHARSQENHR